MITKRQYFIIFILFQSGENKDNQADNLFRNKYLSTLVAASY